MQDGQAGGSPSKVARQRRRQAWMSLAATDSYSCRWRSRRSASGIVSARSMACGDAVDVVRVDDQRLLQLLGARRRTATAPARPGRSASCATTYSLATRFMPSRSGVTRPDRAPRGSSPASVRARMRAVDVAQRHPVELAEAAVDVPRQPLDSRRRMSRYSRTDPRAWRGDLHEARPCGDAAGYRSAAR